MMTLLDMALKIEAAIQAYISIQRFADRQVWKENFRKELVSVIYIAFDHSTFDIENDDPCLLALAWRK